MSMEERNEALRGATARGNGDLVIALLDAGACPNTRDALGNAPLSCAVELGDEKIVTALLRRGADKSVLSYIGYSPARLAIKAGHWPVVEALLNAGAWGSSSFGDASLLSLLLLAAGTSCDPRIFTALIRRGVDVNATDSRGYTAMHRAAMHGPKGSIDSLIAVGADANARSLANGWTPLHRAALHGNSSALVSLLQHGVDVNAKDDGGGTALHIVCRRGIRPSESAAAGVLLRWGADETLTDNDDHIPEDLALMRDEGDAKDRLRVVLARAAVDRSWRRRHWAVMLRRRINKQRVRRLSAAPHGTPSVGGKGGGLEVDGDASAAGGTGAAALEGSGSARSGEQGSAILRGEEGVTGLGREGDATGSGETESHARLEGKGNTAGFGRGTGTEALKGGVLEEEGGTGSGEGGGAEAGEESEGDGVLGWLVGQPEEGVFRLIVKFL